jgi:hypothetical protein
MFKIMDPASPEISFSLAVVLRNRNAIACRTAGIPSLRVLVTGDVSTGISRYDGMAIDSSHVLGLQTEMGAMSVRRLIRQQHIQGKIDRTDELSRILVSRLATEHCLRCKIVQQARATAGLATDLDPGLLLRMNRFESGQSLVEQFQGMMTTTGPDRMTIRQLRELFPSYQRPSTNLRRAQLISEYTLYCAHRFEITDTEQCNALDVV